MRAFFMDLYCPVCQKVNRAVERANLRLPLEFKIDTIDIYSGDPRTKVLAELYGSHNPNKWIVPVIIFDRPVLRRKLGRIVKSTQRVIIHGYQGYEHLTSLLHKLINRR